MREDGDDMLYVVSVEKSSWAQGLDERRLMLAIDFAGMVLEVRIERARRERV